MFTRMLYTVALAFVVAGFAGAAEGDAQPRRGQGGNNQANVLLQHADDLGLTAEQKAKLTEIAKGPMSVLTDDQKTKAREIIAASRPAGAGNGQRRRPNADAAAKPDEKKPEEKKPEEKKEDK